ncbi:predicted protein [Nematostella vectensis]|uniref:OCIA domain-containing protein n=1 Tax=Nematostella vectensis TaxID=45351 RepID=A7T8M3_NEMVE|nr:predicted protein [Nematostella vectensis]|eukprot:XP_001619762.1 hypothetical protein NEMVEDRAFT_v1g223847 [Nematostella vectensis]
MAAQDGGPVMPLELTDEERAVLRECRVNSLYFRGIPLGTVSVLLTREIIKWGYLPKAKRFAGLYYSGMFAVGLFAGIGSYRKACMDKIMRLENSNLANQVREFYKKAGIQEGYGAEQNLSTSDEFGEHKSVSQESLPLTQSPSQELRSDNTESAWPLAHPDDLKATGKTYTSYEDLRKQNRNQWATPQQHPRRDNNLQGAQVFIGLQDRPIAANKYMGNRYDEGLEMLEISLELRMGTFLSDLTKNQKRNISTFRSYRLL